MRFETQMKTGLDVSKEIKQTPLPPQELSMYSLLKNRWGDVIQLSLSLPKQQCADAHVLKSAGNIWAES